MISYRQFQARISSTESAIEDDIRASYNLLRRAVSKRDAELFSALVSDVDGQWFESLEQLFQRGWILDRDFLGLTAVDDAFIIKDIILSDDRKSAQIVTEERYAAIELLPANGSVPLQRTDTFRWDKGWFWFPPTDEYWGGRINQSTVNGQLRIDFPGRDKELVSRLTSDLDALLNKLCTTADYIDCSNGFQFHVELSKDIGSLLDLNEQFFESA